jgi:hypothetical protein
MVECARAISGSSANRRGLHPVCSRNARMRAASASGTCVGECCGRLERSSRHANDSRSAGLAARHRWTHVQTVEVETFAQAADWANVSPSSITHRVTSQRPRAVKRALWCGIRASLKA